MALGPWDFVNSFSAACWNHQSWDRLAQPVRGRGLHGHLGGSLQLVSFGCPLVASKRVRAQALGGQRALGATAAPAPEAPSKLLVLTPRVSRRVLTGVPAAAPRPLPTASLPRADHSGRSRSGAVSAGCPPRLLTATCCSPPPATWPRKSSLRPGSAAQACPHGHS